MTSPKLASDLRRDEGLRLHAYPDPVSGGAPWTIGYGHTGPDVRPGLAWTEAQAEQALEADISRACALLDAHAPWWRDLDDVRQDVLANMCFNMGWGPPDGRHGLGAFRRTLAAVRTGDWSAARDGMLASRWARQVGARATRLASMMLTGERSHG